MSDLTYRDWYRGKVIKNAYQELLRRKAISFGAFIVDGLARKRWYEIASNIEVILK